MSRYFMENGEREHRTYDGPEDNRTVQSFADSCDINKILFKAQKTGTVSHIAAYKAEYGDFEKFDFQAAQNQLARGTQIFEALPSEIRDEFRQNPGEFFKFVNDPANRDQLQRVLPGLALPGRQNMAPGRGREASELPQAASQEASEAPQATISAESSTESG